MRKISVGSFPLISVDAGNRKFVESYLINILSDLINVNQISSSVYDDRAKFITPTVILDYFTKNKSSFSSTNIPLARDTERDSRMNKAKTIKNAFKNTKNLYRSISNDPFFRGHIFYPIYIEEAIKGTNGYSDYKYDFLILSNDLIKNQMLDEIVYDDKITMLFLVLKDILLPYVKLTSLGKVGSGDFRKQFSIFLETCKNENINPFDLFVKIIKIAGLARMSGNTGVSSQSLFSRVTGSGNKLSSRSFGNLFNNEGEIKDVNFLLNLTQGNISDFLDDENSKNIVDPKLFNPITRQYAQAKTHEYSKILSIIDALISFNKQNNTTEEINENQMIAKLKKVENGQEIDLPINIDQILNDLEVIYFKQFLDGIAKKDNSIINEVLKAIKLNKSIGIDFLDDYNNDKKRKVELSEKETRSAILIREIAALKDKINKDLTFINNNPKMDTSKLAKNVSDNNITLMNNETENIKLTNEMGVLQAELLYTKPNIDKKDETNLFSNIIQADIGIDLELYKSHLTTIYGELYTYFYSKEFQHDIVKPFNTNSTGQLMSKIVNSVNELNEMFKKYYIATINEFFETKIYINYTNSNNKNISSRITKDIVNNIKKVVDATFNNNFGLIDTLFTTIFSPIHSKFSNPTIMEAQRIKNLRTEKNPLLRKLLSDTGMFKAFIINEETILGVYDMLHYLDTLKYEVGLINNPVSKVTSDINKITFLINRLGLGENPVFVIGKNEITLSMPNHLSLSGQNFVNKIPMLNFLKVAAINYDKELWSQTGMFETGKDSNEYHLKKEEASKIEALIKKANQDLNEAKKIKDQNKKSIEIKKQQAIIEKNKKIQANNKADLDKIANANPNNFSGNLNPNIRDQYERTWREPNSSNRYDDDMEDNGNSRYENDRINNIRNGMERLSDQRYPDQRRDRNNNQSDQRYSNQRRDQNNNQSNQQVQRVNYNSMNYNGQNEPNERFNQVERINPNYHSDQYEDDQDDDNYLPPRRESTFLNNPYVRNRNDELNQNTNRYN